MILLDTNVVSGLRRPDRADRALLAWASAAPLEAASLSAATILELERGIMMLERRDPRQGSEIRRWFDGDLMPRYANRILPIDAAIARRCAALHVPDPRPVYDALIAATALVHGLTLVTRNVADFAPMGVPVLNPWEAA